MTNYQFILDEIVGQMAEWLIDEQGLSMREALARIYNSDTYTKLLDPANGLAAQSDGYIYDRLVSEQTTDIQ